MVRIIPAALLLSLVVQAQKTDTPYPSMAPLDQYLIADSNAEIALARSAAPMSIANNAEVMVLEREGYKTAVKGTNGFVCIVERSWTAGFGDPEFWNPKIRAPICFNPPAVRAVEARLSGRSGRALASAFDVLGRTNGTQILGRRDAGLSHDRRRGDSGPVNDIHDPSRQVVRRHTGFPR